jgi:hypothetical protein
MHARSLFTGNGYSEDLGFTSNGILNNQPITEGLPDMITNYL